MPPSYTSVLVVDNGASTIKAGIAGDHKDPLSVRILLALPFARAHLSSSLPFCPRPSPQVCAQLCSEVKAGEENLHRRRDFGSKGLLSHHVQGFLRQGELESSFPP